MRLEPKLKDSRHLNRKFNSKLSKAFWKSIKINKPGIFSSFHYIENRSYAFTNIAIFYKSSLIMTNNARQNIFYSSGYNFRHNFCIYIYERIWSPIFYKERSFPFFSISVISACFWELDNSPFSKHTFAHWMKGLQSSDQKFS